MANKDKGRGKRAGSSKTDGKPDAQGPEGTLVLGSNSFFAGYADERGAGDGEGFNINRPLPKGTDDTNFCRALEAVLGDQ